MSNLRPLLLALTLAFALVPNGPLMRAPWEVRAQAETKKAPGGEAEGPQRKSPD